MQTRQLTAALPVAVTLLAAGCVAASWAVTGWSRGDTFGPHDTTCMAARAPRAGAAVPPAGRLTVPEQGFSRIAGRWQGYSVGAMIANGTDRIAYHTTVALRLIDDAGTQPLWEVRKQIPVILPSHRAAVGDLAEGRREPSGTLRLAIQVEETHWADPDPGNSLFRGFDLRPYPPSPSPSPPGDDDWPTRLVTTRLYLAPTGDNRNPCRNLAGTSSGQVFHDRSGQVVGGGDEIVTGLHCEGSHFEATVEVKGYPPTADLAQTDISVYCDVTP